MNSFATTLLRSFAKCMAYGMLVVCALVLVNTTEDSTQQGSTSAKECWIPSTGQILTVEAGAECPAN